MNESKRRSAPFSNAVFRFGLFSLDISAGLLTRNGLRIKLQDQPFQLLALLVERSGGIVTREEIRERLWESNTFVDFDKSLGVAVLKVRDALGDSAANPRFLETVPRRGYRFIAPVSLQYREAESPAAPDSAKSVGASIEAPDQSPGVDAQASSRSGGVRSTKAWLRWLGFAALFCGVVLLLAFSAYWLRRRPSPRGEAPVPTTSGQTKLRRSVAVLGFRNLGGEDGQNWLSGAFTEMLNTELAETGDLRLVSGEDVANVKHDLALPAEDTLAKSTLTRLRSSLGADVVVVGSYTLISNGGMNRIRLDIRAQDTVLGETIFEDAISGNENDLFDLGSEAGSRIRESLNPSLSLAPATDAPLFPESSNQLALQFYSEGRSRLYEFDFVGARDLLKRAVAADPNFALAHSALSSAFSSLGYEGPARDEAKLALQHTRNLPQETTLLIQGQYDESVANWQGASKTYEKLFQLFPDNLSYGLRLAKMQLQANPTAVAHTLSLLRALPAPQGDDPRIDLMEASALIGHDLSKARQAAQKAIAKASAQRATLMAARGYGILCQQDASITGPMDRSVAECNQARNSYLSAGDQNNAARTLNDLAGIYYQQGDLTKAQAMWEEAIAVFRTVGDTQGLAASSNNVGDVLITRGELAKAAILLEQAISGYRLIGDSLGTALALVDLGDIALKRADLQAAKKYDERAFEIGTKIGDKSTVAYSLMNLGDVLTMQDQLPAARQRYESALKLRTETGEKEYILESRVALARLDIEEGHAQGAESEARQCKGQLHQAQLPSGELEAGVVLAGALLRQSRNADAKQELAALRPLEEHSQDLRLRLTYTLEVGKALIAEHDLDASRPLLESVSTQAESAGLITLAMEGQMAQAMLQREAGNISGATEKLNLLQARAQRAGLSLLVRKAANAAKNMTPAKT